MAILDRKVTILGLARNRVIRRFAYKINTLGCTNQMCILAFPSEPKKGVPKRTTFGPFFLTAFRGIPELGGPKLVANRQKASGKRGPRSWSRNGPKQAENRVMFGAPKPPKPNKKCHFSGLPRKVTFSGFPSRNREYRFSSRKRQNR